MVQRHTPPAPGPVHYDLMIEDGGALVTVQLAAPPDRPAEGTRSFDHRLVYLEYEGELTRGRGRVAIWDRGELDDVTGGPRDATYRAALRGERLRGAFELREEPAASEAPARVRWAPAPAER